MFLNLAALASMRKEGPTTSAAVSVFNAASAKKFAGKPRQKSAASLQILIYRENGIIP